MTRWCSAFLLVSLAACAHAPPPAPPTPIMKAAVSGPRPAAPAIDVALRAEWKKNGVTPAAKADDATFLRRAYLDIVGNVPPLDVTTKFIEDPAPDKRARIIDTLLASPEYAEHWMNYWDDVLMGRDVRGNVVDRVAFRLWLRDRFAANTSWDRVASELVAATGQNGTNGPRAKVAAPMGVPMTEPETDLVDPNTQAMAVNGAVNWALKYAQAPQDFGGTASRVFLGVQIQCAQCHDHKTESWKQDDFRKFTAAFLHARVEPIDPTKVGGAARRVNLVDIGRVPPRFAKKAELQPIVQARPTALDGTDLAKGEGTRKALATWMTSKENPWFAKAFVNRMWGHFLGRGFVDPVDDMRPSNPTTMPELLAFVATDFAARGFDPKELIRTICATEAYQLAASADAKTDAENKLWARFHLVPLGPEELLNAVFRATDLEHTAEKLGVRNMEQLRTNVARQYTFLFDTDEETDAPDYSGTVSQALTLLNGALVTQGARALPGSMTADLVKAAGSDEEKVDALALRVFARHPTPAERARWVAYVNEATTGTARAAAGPARKDPLGPLARRNPALSAKAAAYEDLLWSMLNSSEFTFNH